MPYRAEEDAGEYSFGGPATTLPAAPGVFVNGVGSIPLPLGDDTAAKLITVCDKSPFGRRLDTLMDENVRKSWQLQPDQVDIKNPLWQRGIEQLSGTIADRLCYKDVPLQCVMYKLLVYGEGGHFAKHQDTEKEDGMVATLVIQLPKLHEGGDLVVYRGKSVQYRHDFGKADGTAAYRPLYAVHYADAEHALETVTSGYRLVIVYSICLPPTMHHLRKDHSKSLSEELAGAISRMEGEDGSFALLLSHEYTEKSIGDMGTKALKGVDRARFQALEEANSIVASDKKLHFFIARLSHQVDYWEDGRDTDDWREDRRDENITWYSTSGKTHGKSKEMSLKAGMCDDNQEVPDEAPVKLNFLNPGRETSYTKHHVLALCDRRLAGCTSCGNAFKFINVAAAAGALQSQKPVNAAALRTYMNIAYAKLAEQHGSHSWDRTDNVSVGLCRGLCEMLVEADDPSLVNLFFANFFSQLKQLEDKEALVPSIIAIARAFDWADIGQTLLNSLKGTVDDTGMGFSLYARAPNTTDVEMMLRLIDGLERGAAQNALLHAALNNIKQLDEKVLCSSKSVALLWKWAICSDDQKPFDVVASKCKQVNPELLRPVIDAFSQHLNDIDAADEKLGVLASIAAKRVEWLDQQLLVLGRPFSWEMPNASFPDNGHVQAFLRGPNVTMDTRGVRSFNGIQHARNYANKWMREKQINASFELEAEGRGRDAYCIITKTRAWFPNTNRSC